MTMSPYGCFSLILVAIFGLTNAQYDLMFGEDEQQQKVKPFCNDAYQWTCANGECIAQYDLCDGITQCEDGSDEMNCKMRPQPHQEEAAPARKVEFQPKPNVTTTTSPKTTSPNEWSLKVVAASLFLILGLAALVHFILKRRKANQNRNFRKGESLIDDEDDLLISQMYA